VRPEGSHSNKGEWSKIYTLLKFIADKKLFAVDSELNKIEDIIFPIIRILRDESRGEPMNIHMMMT
jgi:hypothetical protein